MQTMNEALLGITAAGIRYGTVLTWSAGQLPRLQASQEEGAQVDAISSCHSLLASTRPD